MSELKAHKETFLLPVWIDIVSNEPRETMRVLNELLTEFFEEVAHLVLVREYDCSIDVQWSINQHIQLNGRREGEQDA